MMVTNAWVASPCNSPAPPTPPRGAGDLPAQHPVSVKTCLRGFSHPRFLHVDNLSIDHKIDGQSWEWVLLFIRPGIAHKPPPGFIYFHLRIKSIIKSSESQQSLADNKQPAEREHIISADDLRAFPSKMRDGEGVEKMERKKNTHVYCFFLTLRI